MDSLVLPSEEVLLRWNEFMYEVIHASPQFVQRNNENIFLSISLEMTLHLLEHLYYPVEVVYDVEMHQYTARIKGVEIIEVGETQQRALQNYFQAYIFWAGDYLKGFTLNYNSPELKPQFPFVLKAFLLNDVDKLVSCTRFK